MIVCFWQLEVCKCMKTKNNKNGKNKKRIECSREMTHVTHVKTKTKNSKINRFQVCCSVGEITAFQSLGPGF